MFDFSFIRAWCPFIAGHSFVSVRKWWGDMIFHRLPDGTVVPACPCWDRFQEAYDVALMTKDQHLVACGDTYCQNTAHFGQEVSL